MLAGWRKGLKGAKSETGRRRRVRSGEEAECEQRWVWMEGEERASELRILGRRKTGKAKASGRWPWPCLGVCCVGAQGRSITIDASFCNCFSPLVGQASETVIDQTRRTNHHPDMYSPGNACRGLSICAAPLTYLDCASFLSIEAASLQSSSCSRLPSTANNPTPLCSKSSAIAHRPCQGSEEAILLVAFALFVLEAASRPH